VLPGKVFLPVSLGQNEGDSGFPWLTWLIVWGVPHRLLLRLWLRGSFGKSGACYAPILSLGRSSSTTCAGRPAAIYL
jgi:hypothetical protein